MSVIWNNDGIGDDQNLDNDGAEDEQNLDNDGIGDEWCLGFFTYITINITFYLLFYGPYIPHPGIFKTMSYFLWSV